MNILMYTNYPPKQLNIQGFVNEGWVSGLQDELSKYVIVHIAFPSNNKVFKRISDTIYAFGYSNAEDIYEYPKIKDIDIIHIMGTEFKHSYTNYIKLCEIGMKNRIVVSIQGLVSFCAQHYLYGVPKRYCVGGTLIEIYSHLNSLNKQKKRFEERGVAEQKLLAQCKNIIGRTDWDRRCVEEINPNVNYYHNGENLRSVFYSGDKWTYDKCEKHSIFVSQATYALKGLHHVLKILPQIVKRFPDTIVYIGGDNPIASNIWKRNSYAKYLNTLIHDGCLEKHIIFCGSMTAEQMCARYVKSHVFLSPSNIENSSNSIGEALILGVPVVASNVGGTDSIVNDGINGLLYPLTEPYIMAAEIIEIFSNNVLANYLSGNAVIQGSKLHDREKNVQELISIYEEIIEANGN